MWKKLLELIASLLRSSPPYVPFTVTPQIALEIASHEGLVLEAYKDSKGIWTWGIGVTNASGHQVYPRYKDNPQSAQRCFEVFIWLLENKYAPAVRRAFAGCELTEEQFGAALSFHYNTGAIERATWVKLYKEGKVEEAKTAFMNWKKPPEIVSRRKKEQQLFFDGLWSSDGRVTVWPVAKPSYKPQWSAGYVKDVTKDLEALL